MRLFWSFLLFICGVVATAQHGHHHHHHHHYAKVKIELNETQNIEALARLGLDVEHGVWKRQQHFISDFSEVEIAQIQAAGFKFEILIEDVQAYYMNESARQMLEERGGENCDEEEDIITYDTPENFELGSMGGFYTYEEMLSTLDEMVEKYPHLLSPRTPIGDIRTHEDRPIYWLRLSDNPELDEADEPEVLYTALHHAREPAGLSQMLFYIWYLLENYETDPEVQYLVDNTELYFIPCINPDGYVYNQTIRPQGGGLHRKNMRQNENGSLGVDLNRNYGFSWAYDDSGSSSSQSSATYRGPSEFSEPETQAVRDFCNAHEFLVALNYHTYGNLLIHPWGFLDTPTEDAPTFNALARAMTLENDYRIGTGTQTVGYTVNGDSDDWMYGETETKPKIYSMTPEVGEGFDGFWPARSRIRDLCKDALLMNFVTAHVAHTYPLLEHANSKTLNGLEHAFRYSLQNIGLRDGEVQVALEALSDNVTSLDEAKNYTLNSLDAIEDAFNYTLVDDIADGEEVVFILRVDNGLFAREDTVRQVYSSGATAFTDDISTVDNWEGEWALTEEKFVSAPTSLTDSPEGEYGYNIRSTTSLKEAIDLEEAVNVRLRFNAQWDLGEGDYVLVEINMSEAGFFPLCTEYTDEFIRGAYVGRQPVWVQEDIDITEYLEIGTSLGRPLNLSIRLRLVSDNYQDGDGYYMDDLELFVIREDNTTDVISIDEAGFDYHAVPNPASGDILIQFDQSIAAGQLHVFNALGKRITQVPVAGSQVRVPSSDWAAGIYFYQLEVAGQLLESKRVILSR